MTIIYKNLVYQSILNFCGNDHNAANELLALIKTSINDAEVSISRLDLASNSEEIAQLVHKLRFSFSVIGRNDLQEEAAKIENTIAEKGKNNNLAEEYQNFLLSFHDLNTQLKNMT